MLIIVAFGPLGCKDGGVTIKAGVCAKCSLKETSACQNAVKVKENDKTVTYYLVHNQVSKDFHQKICTSTAKVVATGTVKEANGKLEMTPTKIELDK